MALSTVQDGPQVVRAVERYSSLLRRGLNPKPLSEEILGGLPAALEDQELVRDLVPALLDILALPGELVPGGVFHVRAGGTSLGALRKIVVRTLRKSGSEAPLMHALAFGTVLDRGQKDLPRLTALDLLHGNRFPAGRQCLLTLGRSREDSLRSKALMYAAAWNDPALDRMLVGLLREEQVEGLAHPSVPLLLRTRIGRRPLGKGARKDLRPILMSAMADPDWKESTRAIQLSRGFAPEDRVPLLIDGMLIWDQRKRAKEGSRRVTHDFSSALSAISGRTIGSNPRNWIQWWVSVRQGKIPMHKPASSAKKPHTTASFFGLGIDGDRVTFVLDNSGSMGGENLSGVSRHELALEQLFGALEGLGREVYFNVILFSSGPLTESGDMVRATPKNIARLRTSLSTRGPGGGTNLRPAIEKALGHEGSGKIDPDECLPDTVVVLCDGGTSSGPHWVDSYLERLLPVLQVRFHCVLLGSAGDGTLEKLAQLSGGQIVLIDS